MAKIELFQFKPLTRLLDLENEIALFNTFGNFIYLQDSLIDARLSKVCQFLSDSGVSKNQFSKFSFSKNEFKRLFYLLDVNGLIQKKKRKNSTVAPSKKGENFVYSFLSQFFENVDEVKGQYKKFSDVTIVFVDCCNVKNFLKASLKRVKITNYVILDQKKIYNYISDTSIGDNVFFVVLSSWQGAKNLLDLNRHFFEKRAPWLMCLFDDFGGQIGPFFTSKDSPCFACMNSRRVSLLDDNNMNTHLLSNFLSRLDTNYNFKYFSSSSLISLLQIQIIKIICNIPSPQIFQGSISVDTLNAKTQFNELFAVDFCAVCAPIDNGPLGNIKLHN